MIRIPPKPRLRQARPLILGTRAALPSARQPRLSLPRSSSTKPAERRSVVSPRRQPRRRLAHQRILGACSTNSNPFACPVTVTKLIVQPFSSAPSASMVPSMTTSMVIGKSPRPARNPRKTRRSLIHELPSPRSSHPPCPNRSLPRSRLLPRSLLDLLVWFPPARNPQAPPH